MSPQISQYLDEFLAGKLSEAQVREVLLLIDNSGALLSDFEAALKAVQRKIPGLSLDFETLLANDPIECDPLVSQGNLALLRLNTVYYQAFEAWTKSGGDLYRFKRITKGENPATYSDRLEKHERTDQNYPPDAQLLNQVVNITLSAFRIQATITHRREQLRNPALNTPQAPKLARPANEETGSRSPEAPVDNRYPHSAPSAPPSDTQSDLIDADESLAEAIDLMQDEESDLPRINGIGKLGKLNGYNQLDFSIKPPTSKSSTPSAPPPESEIQSNAKSQSETDSAKNFFDEIREELAVTEATVDLSLRSYPRSVVQREPGEFTHNKPHFNKRE